jgi:hypothetical protein
MSIGAGFGSAYKNRLFGVLVGHNRLCRLRAENVKLRPELAKVKERIRPFESDKRQ